MKCSFATLADDAEFAKFSCCPPDGAGWLREVENYVRVSALKRAEHVLVLRDDGSELLAVSAFDSRTIDFVPINHPIEVGGWHLYAVAVRLTDQRKGICAELFARTFEAMRTLNRTRSLVTADVHRHNDASIRACAKAGLESLPRNENDDYVTLLGPVAGTRLPSFDP